MSAPNLLSECKSYITLNLAPRDLDPNASTRQAPAITLSRQTGARGIAICENLHAKLQERSSQDSLPWTLYDSQLGKQILKDHNLPEHLLKFIPDDSVGELEATINELLGRHPSLWELFADTVDTIERLANTGHSIIVGRGANRITETLNNVLSVRLIGSREVRLNYVIEHLDVSPKLADDLLKREDSARRNFVKQHFHCDIDDPYLYNLVINTDQLSDSGVVDIIIAALDSLKP